MIINYSAVIKDFSPYFFYSSDGNELFQINRKYSLFTIRNPQGDDMLKFEVKNLLSKKIKILDQDFEKIVYLIKEKKKYKLVVEDDKIYIDEKFKILSKYEASIMVNEKEIGYIKEENVFPYKKYDITFNTEDDINFYCIILFAIISVHFADGI